MAIGSSVPYNAGTGFSYTRKNNNAQNSNFKGALLVPCAAEISLGAKAAYSAGAVGFLTLVAAWIKNVIKKPNVSKILFK